jgi:hypothetical protein
MVATMSRHKVVLLLSHVLLDRVVLVVIRHHVGPLEDVAPGDLKVVWIVGLALRAMSPGLDLDDCAPCTVYNTSGYGWIDAVVSRVCYS